MSERLLTFLFYLSVFEQLDYCIFNVWVPSDLEHIGWCFISSSKEIWVLFLNIPTASIFSSIFSKLSACLCCMLNSAPSVSRIYYFSTLFLPLRFSNVSLSLGSSIILSHCFLNNFHIHILYLVVQHGFTFL